MKLSRILGGRLGKAAEWARNLVPLWCRAWLSRCTGPHGERVPHRLRPLASCIICRTTRFRRWSRAHPLSFSGRLQFCVRCRSLPRHRSTRKIWLHLRRKDFKRARCLQFSHDPSVRRTWFRNFELSIFNGANSIDVQDIARSDASYDIVICNHVIEHVPDHRRALRELGRILSAHGFLFLSVPDPARRARTDDWGRPDPSRHHHFREFGTDLTELLKQELPDLSIVEVQAIDDTTGDPDLAYVLTRNRTWFRRVRSLPFTLRVHAERPFAA